MSRKIDPVFQTAFDAEVKRSYGDKQALAGTTREKSGVVGKAVQFRKKGKGMASRHMGGSDITAMNVDYKPVECILEDWEAFDYVDKFDAKKINFSEVKELAEVAADAVGLRMDQIKIDALKKGYNSTDMSVGTATTALTVATLIKATGLLDDNGVPEEGRTFIHSVQQKNDLLNTTEVTSSDYNSVQALVKGEVKTYLGLNFIKIAKREEGGLPIASGGVTGFIYHKDAVGTAIGQNIETDMDWISEKRAYLVGADFSAGAVVIDDEGVVAVVSKAA